MMRKTQTSTMLLTATMIGLIVTSCNSNKSTGTDTLTAKKDVVVQVPAITKDSSVNDDFSKRSADIHWPKGFSPRDADLFAHNEIYIRAPRTIVWKNIITAKKWPEWYSNSHNVKITGSIDGILKKDNEFKWQTFGLDIISHVHEYVPESRVGWFGDGKGFNGYHTWLLTDSAGGCKVVMEEVGKGPGAAAMHKINPNGMHKGHDLWNSSLKNLSEKGI